MPGPPAGVCSLMARQPRAVVIGAGIGGLAAAIELQSAGVQVTLVERASGPGGKMHEVAVGGAGIDSGPTVFTMRWVFEELFKAAGTSFDEHVTLSRPDRLARHSWHDGSRLDLYADIDRSVAEIETFADRHEAEGYRRFAKASENMFETLDHTFMRRERPSPVGLTLSLGIFGIPRLLRTRPFRSLWLELDRYFHDPRLKQLFGRYATYCGSSPFSAPATLALIAHAERAGVWLVDGGMQRLADALATVLTEAGATIHYDAEASGFLKQGERVTGVVLADGSAMSADAIVFNGDVAAISRGLFGAEYTHAVPARAREPRSLSAVTWCFKARVEGLPLDHHTVLFGNDYAAEFDDIFDAGRVTDRPTVYICAQDRGHGRSPAEAGRERLFMLVNAPPKSMPDDALARVVDNTFAQIESHGLRFRDVETVVTTRPDDFDERFPGSDGAIYGWPTHGWSGSFRRGGSRSGLEGLYLAGGTVHPGPGVPMTAISGRLAAASVLSDLGLGC